MDQSSSRYGDTKEDAIRAEKDGIPSLLPDTNRWKYIVELHRWGYRDEAHKRRCPVCQQDS